MKYLKLIAGGVASLLIITFLAKLNYVRALHLAGDTAGYVDLLKHIYRFNDMRSSVFAAAYPVFDLTKTAAGVCSSALLNTYEQASFFRWHSYGLAFPIAWIGGRLTNDFAAVAAVVNALSVYGIFAAALLIARKQKFNLIEIGLFALLLVSFTPLVGAISGQYYFDRLFIPLALFYYYLHLENERRACWIASVAVIICAALVSERSSLMIGALAIYLSAFDTKDKKAYRLLTIGAGLLAIGYYVLWSKVFQNSLYASTTSLSAMMANVRTIFDLSSPLSMMTRELLVVLLPMLVLLFGNKKYLLLALAFLAPNLLLTVGGAEKTGYATHYHSYYIPIILFGALMGYARYKQSISNIALRYALLVVLLVCNIANIHNRQFPVGPTLTHTLSGDAAMLVEGTARQQAAQAWVSGLNELLSLIDKPDPTISANEFVMPIMVSRNITRIRLFPIGLYDSDYLLIESAAGGDDSQIILPIYGDPADLQDIVKCLYPKIGERFTEIGSKEILGIKYRLFKAKQ
ncbi:DUF2079 domain-containing protein [Herbaspirillum sp. DW155]|uniref:hypothetical protein n=1 Tax=Herbaspirillum sp. DW155 TaxID=3095609 RepID=UPI003087C9D8|nr:DUF2079 domain-containing protein [Herbaspirillum sp. DW155]